VTTLRSVPLAYADLVNEIDAGAFPWERNWIDFKRRLYPDDPSEKGGRARVSAELAKDLASMAVQGGYLVYGVAEDKALHTFHVDEMPLEVGLHETVDAVARSRITPPLYVVPTPVPNPGQSTGFLVVHVPASPDAPHMADSIYWGRSETGKVRLTDAEVERLIVLRGRQAERLHGAMKDTVACDPTTDRGPGAHFYFTAVPATSWPEMFADYAKDHAGRVRLGQLFTKILNEQGRSDALTGMMQDRRTHQVEAGWLQTWVAEPPSHPNGARAVGVDDGGTVRFINVTAASPPRQDGSHRLFEVLLLDEVVDMLYLIAALAGEVGYTGTWHIGAHLDRLRSHRSQLSDPYSGNGTWVLGGNGFDGTEYTRTTTASAAEIREKPHAVAVRLMRPLMRGLGSEAVLSNPPYLHADGATRTP